MRSDSAEKEKVQKNYNSAINDDESWEGNISDIDSKLKKVPGESTFTNARRTKPKDDSQKESNILSPK